MKKAKFTSILLLVVIVAVSFVATGCDLLGSHSHVWSKDFLNDGNYHWQKCTICSKTTTKAEHEYGSWRVETQATATASGLRVRECEVCEYQDDEEIPPIVNENPNPSPDVKGGTVDFYAINDFHGAYEKLAQVAGYISARLDEGNAVALNSGDMFQGSMQSNSNYGSLFAECMDVAGFDAFTYGNHEFDWGVDNLKTLATNSATPYLGANIYHGYYDNSQSRWVWGDFANDIAQKYVIKELPNGLRVGIIGVIGEDQITSISSQLVQTIGFKDPLPIIKELATELREERKCDVVVVSAHASPQGLFGEKESYSQPSSSYGLCDYVDAVFCAHSHSRQDYIVDGIPFIQGGSSGNYVSHVQLTVSNGNVRCDGHSNTYYTNLYDVDVNTRNQVQTLIDNSNTDINNEANEVIATLSDTLDKDVGIPRLVCHAIADYVASQNVNVDVVICNEARADFTNTTVTYNDLYKALPFDNVIYVARVTGRQIYNEIVTYKQSMWRVSETAIENSTSKYYTIAVIDYLLFHQNTDRQYNYFSSAFYTSNTLTPYALTKTGVDLYHYRLITRDFLKAQNGTIYVTLYTNTNNRTDASKLTQAVTF